MSALSNNVRGTGGTDGTQFPREQNQIYLSRNFMPPVGFCGMINGIPGEQVELPRHIFPSIFGSREGALKRADDFADLYRRSSDHEATQRTIDSLAVCQKQEAVLAYLCTFSGSNIFPSLGVVSNTILAHAQTIARRAAKKMNLDIVFSGCDRASSLGRRLALPASDIDHWTLIIRGHEGRCADLRAEIHRSMNPLIADLLHSTHKPPLVLTLDELLRMSTQCGGRDSFYLYMLPFDQWEPSIEKWKNVGPLESKPYRASTEPERSNLKAALGSDEIRERWLAASCALEILRDGTVIFDGLGAELSRELKNSLLFKTSDILKQLRNASGLQSKHRAREVFERFDSLSVEEQFLLVRTIMERHLWNDSAHEYLLSLAPLNPHLPIVELLLTKGFLCYADPGLAPNAPTDLPASYEAHRPYLIPGKMARAPWHEHYPFEASLPFDY